MEEDWRLFSNKHMIGITLQWKRYADRMTSTDHDHCEFCGIKFSTQIEDSLTEGYAAEDDYRWVCSTCFNDFKERLGFKVNM